MNRETHNVIVKISNFNTWCSFDLHPRIFPSVAKAQLLSFLFQLPFCAHIFYIFKYRRQAFALSHILKMVFFHLLILP